MTRLLRRISPQSQQSNTVQGQKQVRVVSGDRKLRFDPVKAGSQSAKLPNDAIQSELEDQLLAEVNACLRTVRDESIAEPRVQDSRSMVSAIESNGPPPAAPVAKTATRKTGETARKTARVQLRLSKASVKVLKAFSKTGRQPSVIVERALWRDPAVQDAAAILRLRQNDV